VMAMMTRAEALEGARAVLDDRFYSLYEGIAKALIRAEARGRWEGIEEVKRLLTELQPNTRAE
jgi:RNA-splicing ligase RtcB